MVRSRGVPRRQPEAGGPTLRVLTINLLVGRADAEAVVARVRQADPDVLFVQELTADAQTRLKQAGLEDLLPHAQIEHRDGGPRGSGIYSRFPLSEGPSLPATFAAQPTALLELPGGEEVELICVHPRAPALERGGSVRWRAELAVLPAPGKRPRVVAGDFNATVDHAAFRDVLRLGYVDAAIQTGNALTRTWGPPDKGRGSPSTTCWSPAAARCSRARCTRPRQRSPGRLRGDQAPRRRSVRSKSLSRTVAWWPRSPSDTHQRERRWCSVSDLEVIKYRPDPAEYAWTFGGAAPVRSITTPVVLDLFTEDCFAGRVRSSADLVSRLNITGLNPQTGPFYIEGAEPGDTVAVHFVSIEPARDWAASTTVPLFGALTGTHLTALLNEPLEELMWIWQLDRAARTCRFQARKSDFTADLPMDPMHGTIGVAPAGGEVRSALVPDAFGGNMDTPEMRAGTTCYLGVNVDGALLSLGDGHARQGEGETCGVAVETAMNTTIIVDLIKNVATPWPRLENDAYIMSAGSPARSRTRSASPSTTW